VTRRPAPPPRLFVEELRALFRDDEVVLADPAGVIHLGVINQVRSLATQSVL